MEIIQIGESEAKMIAPLAALFRVALKQFKGISSLPDNDAGLAEIVEYLNSGFPCFAAKEGGTYTGYLVCRVDRPVVWVESVFVHEAYRRKGTATALFKKAEEIAASFGETTVYNYVHPNNSQMIAFLRRHGYTVLNLIEIRKPYPDEKLLQKIDVGENTFDY
ncbi:GNAT family N-acetyltransferase [Murimonas intestini]|uniref:Ribosomal protein S18 acetylase RimI-like enzyme n=1 Tax=Murimonas intestini TaxID=1337051 RepID=A0AB73T028_9FIRM|nr:GNAT family N-acetyltransferase [Murimonas intestini]MCR1843227.1 GNAT family N-acetyltransferase [Murimonas intestini]MCR1868544.1 GNAT family N-acetyltransferase [Murimonas intestini]MCR1885113.1 GNAT family N-acetyltransferase [Murimonas intestini]